MSRSITANPRAAAAGGNWRKAGDESINEPVIVLKERNDGA
jgi:hypothetical protein